MADLLPPDGDARAEPRPRSGETPERSTCVLLNPGSGKRGRDGLTEELRTLLGRVAGRVEVRRVRGRDIARETDRALEDGFATIVAAGGDGTISGVAAQVAGTGRRLGVLPLGTFNYFARGLGLPLELDEAVRVLADGRATPVQAGEVNGRVFLNNASLGIYPAILQRREHVYRRWGRSQLAAYWSVLLALVRFRRPLRLTLTVDGQVRRRKTPLVFVANNSYQLELFGVPGADCVRAGRFAVIVAPDCGRLELVVFALRLAFGRMVPERDFELFCGSEVEVEGRVPRRLVAFDGERDVLRGPFRFHVRRDALRVLVPAEHA